MILKKTTCLLLTLALICAVAAPVFADGNPPPPSGGGNIHPWDNNDGTRSSGGPLITARRPAWFGYGFNGHLVTIPTWSMANLMKSDRSSSETGSRQSAATLRVVVKSR